MDIETVIETATKFASSMYDQRHLVAYYIGIFFVIVSHLYMLRQPNMYWHSIFNLLAAMLIAYYFMDKEFGYGASKKEEKKPEAAPVTAPVPAPKTV